MKPTYRRLPHIYIIGRPLFITYRLHGSLPPGRHFDRKSLTSGQAFLHLDQLLDSESCGPLYLKMPNIAAIVANSIHQGSGSEYNLHAWVIMPNHVHLLLTPISNVSKFLQRLKGASALQANQQLGLLHKPFWQTESYDRLVRDNSEFQRVTNYIVQNPVKAGLVASQHQYPWSSAWPTALC